MTTRQFDITIVGAGPVGVVAALAAVQAGFSVVLLEAANEIDTSPRAATTHPSTLELIERVGLLDRFKAEGLAARHFDFRDRESNELIARFDHALLEGETPHPYVVQTEQHKLARMGIDALQTYAEAEVHFGTRVEALVQNDDGVTITAQGPGGPQTFASKYAIGADGGRSTVRKMLGIEFEGMTWPEKFIVLTVLDDFEQMLGASLRNYLADPEEWVNLFKVSGDDGLGRWRAVFPSKEHESDEEAHDVVKVEARLQRLYAKPEPYRLLHTNIYRVHQRVAKTFRGGRVFLAGDSAHVNNPIGGLGLNCGIHDAMELIDTLVEVTQKGPNASLLDRYERRRRRMNIEFVQQQTIINKKRLEQKDPAARKVALDELRATADNPARHKAFLMRSSLIESVRESKHIE